MTPDEYGRFREQCRTELRQKIGETVARWKLDCFKRYDFDQASGTLTFSDDSGPRVVCDVQIIGSFSTKSQTWLWAWDHPWVLEHLKNDAKLVHDFGCQHDIEPLKTRKWTAEESDGWDMTAIAAHLADAEGAYRAPNKDTLIFTTIKRIRE